MTNNLSDPPRVCEIHGTVMVYAMRQYFCWDCMDEEREQSDRERAIQQMRQRLSRTHVPPRYHDTTLRDFLIETPAQQLVLNTVRDYIWRFPDNYSCGRCLIFMGGVGTGKTLLASAALQTLANIEFPKRKKRDGDDPGYFYYPEYITVTALIRKIRDTWRSDAKESTSCVIDHYAGVHLLALDEIGAGAGTVNELTLLAEILDIRFQSALPMIAITNLGRKGLLDTLGEPGVDRLRSCDGQLCLFDWPSWRGNKNGSEL